MKSQLKKNVKPAEIKIDRTEFWSTRHETYRGQAAIEDMNSELAKRAQPGYQKDRNAEVIESYREYANWLIDSAKRILEVPFTQRRKMTDLPPKDLALLKDEQVRQLDKDARTVLLAADNLLNSIQNGDLHVSIDAAMRLQREWERLLVRRHEQNAVTGRIHRERSKEGADETNRIKQIPLKERNDRIHAEWAKGATTEALSRRFDLSESQIRKILQKYTRMR